MQSVPVISTGHLSLKTNEILKRDSHAVPWCHCAGYQYGYWLSVPSDHDEVSADAPSAPDDLIDVLEWARQSGFEWVRLDALGDQVDVLPFYG